MTPPLFLIKAASAIVGNRLAPAGAWLLIALMVGSLLWLGKCTYDRSVIAGHERDVTRKVTATDRGAKDEAADQRARDRISIDQAEKERKDAINAAPAGRPDDARNRLNCERLRRSGLDTRDFAECR